MHTTRAAAIGVALVGPLVVGISSSLMAWAADGDDSASDRAEEDHRRATATPIVHPTWNPDGTVDFPKVPPPKDLKPMTELNLAQMEEARPHVTLDARYEMVDATATFGLDSEFGAYKGWVWILSDRGSDRGESAFRLELRDYLQTGPTSSTDLVPRGTGDPDRRHLEWISDSGRHVVVTGAPVDAEPSEFSFG